MATKPSTSSKTVLIAFRVPVEFAAKLKERAARRGLSLTAYLLAELGDAPTPYYRRAPVDPIVSKVLPLTTDIPARSNLKPDKPKRK